MTLFVVIIIFIQMLHKSTKNQCLLIKEFMVIFEFKQVQCHTHSTHTKT